MSQVGTLHTSIFITMATSHGTHVGIVSELQAVIGLVSKHSHGCMRVCILSVLCILLLLCLSVISSICCV